jgi:N-acetylmuramoyl-L-alanine amidase
LFRLFIAAILTAALLALSASPGATQEEEQQMVETRYLGHHSYGAFTRLVFDTGGVRPRDFHVNYDPAAKRVVLYPDKGLLAYSFAPVGPVDDLVREVDFIEDDTGKRGVVVRFAQGLLGVKASYLSEPDRIVLDLFRNVKAGENFFPPGRPVRTIALDPGHGGHTAGSGGGEMTEKNLALDVALRLKRLLGAKGFKVVMTREGDTDASPDERAGIANGSKADLFLSVHAAGSFQKKGQGACVYTMDADGLDGPAKPRGPLAWEDQNAPYLAEGMRLAVNLAGALGKLYGADTSVRQTRLAGMDGLTMPAVMVEIGDLSDPDQSARLADDAFRNTLAARLAKGVEDFAKGAGAQ